jgi:hypothetical protein
MLSFDGPHGRIRTIHCHDHDLMMTSSLFVPRGLDDLVEETPATAKETSQGIAYSRAEELAFRSRTARMEKLKKRRDAARAYKELENKNRELEAKQPGAAGGGGRVLIDNNHSEDHDDFSVDAGPRARQRRLALEFKRINGGFKKGQQQQQQGSQFMSSTTTGTGTAGTMEEQSGNGFRRLSSRSDSTLSVGGFSEDMIPEGEERDDGDDNRSLQSMMSFGNKSNQPTLYHSLSSDTQHTAIQSLLDQKTDMLEWDRQEREQEMDLMQAMMKYGSQVREETKRVVRQAAKETAKNTAVNVS